MESRTISKPKVSIVLPVYNGEKYLEEAINSIIQQTYSEWELIIVDDCSQDSTPDIIKRYAEIDSRIRPVRNKQNSKLPASLNNGFSIATGEYLTWTSDDNKYKENAICKMVEYLDSHLDTDFVYADYVQIGEQGEALHQILLPQSDKLPIQNTVGACFMYRRALAEKVGNYAEKLFLIEDYDYWIRCYLKGNFGHISETLYEYRVHNNSLTSKRKKEIYDKQIELRRRYYEALKKKLTGKKEYVAFLYSSREFGIPEAPSFVGAVRECPSYAPFWFERKVVWKIKEIGKNLLSHIFPSINNKDIKY